MSVVKTCFFGIAVMLCAAKVWGQAAPSPFTDFGIGDAYGNSNSQSRLRGIGVSILSTGISIIKIPLLVFNTLTVFEVGSIYESQPLKPIP
jgi:hypothetical protein